ncbi:MAG: hypothetical protein ACRDU4_07575 [Mycobacterium sp.]
MTVDPHQLPHGSRFTGTRVNNHPNRTVSGIREPLLKCLIERRDRAGKRHGQCNDECTRGNERAGKAHIEQMAILLPLPRHGDSTSFSKNLSNGCETPTDRWSGMSQYGADVVKHAPIRSAESSTIVFGRTLTSRET